jgi:hypothetical protein
VRSRAAVDALFTEDVGAVPADTDNGALWVLIDGVSAGCSADGAEGGPAAETVL